jgi:hypothetical protein
MHGRAGWILSAAFLLLALGCHTTKRYDTSVPVVEEFNPPPNEPRYNNPPESAYRKPAPKKEMNIREGIGPQGPGMGPGVNGMGGMGGGPGRF